jgi:hypothetical protein
LNVNLRVGVRHGTHDTVPDGTQEISFCSTFSTKMSPRTGFEKLCQPVRGLEKPSARNGCPGVISATQFAPNAPTQQHCRLHQALFEAP